MNPNEHELLKDIYSHSRASLARAIETKRGSTDDEREHHWAQGQADAHRVVLSFFTDYPEILREMKERFGEEW